MLYWLWGIHNFWHQTLNCLSRRKPAIPSSGNNDQPVVVLYATCDDFDPIACHSSLAQTYSHMRLIICDDSYGVSSRSAIDEWARRQGEKVTVIRRPERRRFKAGNINHAIAKYVKEEFIVVCDADEVIPPDFVQRMIPYFYDEKIAFVQARHKVRSRADTKFASILGLSIDIFYEYSLPLRNRFGFVSCFGHGVVIRRSAWEAVGGFPEIVSEDLGFASRALALGMRGIYAEDVVAEEAFPATYKAFVSKYRRVIGGTAEYFRKEFGHLVRSNRATLTEKLDVLLTFSYCYIGLVTMINVIGGIFLSYLCQLEGYDRLAIWLLCVYLLGPLTPVGPAIIALLKTPKRAGHYLIVAPIAYASLIPTMAAKAIGQLALLKSPIFIPTGMVARQQQHIGDNMGGIVCGLCVLAMAIIFPSTILPPSVCLSLMFMLGPLMSFSESSNTLGLVGRYCGVIPYGVMGAIMFLKV
jgi:cellulose synthase/poly-beta-1,6-N-acetylglucosamine synthase-like glycosyltransferase